MKNKRIIIILFIMAIALVAVVTVKIGLKEPHQRTTSVRLNWMPSCSFVGEILGSSDFAQSNNLELEVLPGGPGIDPIKLVQSGADTFGVAGADLVLVANDKGADFVIIGLVSYDSPGVWLAKKQKNIRTINDVRGKRIGELPGGNMQYLYEVFLKRTQLERNKDFTPVPIPFDLKNFIAQDECDLRPVFVYDEPTDLTLAGIEYTMIEPRNLGIQFKGICYFCKRETIRDHPEIVQAFIDTMAKGWETALNDPERAIASLKKFDGSVNSDKELLGLKAGRSYLSGYEGKVLMTDQASWEPMINDMLDLGFISKHPKLDELLQMQFVNGYHARTKNGVD